MKQNTSRRFLPLLLLLAVLWYNRPDPGGLPVRKLVLVEAPACAVTTEITS